MLRMPSALMALLIAVGCSVCADGDRPSSGQELESLFPLAPGTTWLYKVKRVTDLARSGARVEATWMYELEIADRMRVREGDLCLVEERASEFKIVRAEGIVPAELAGLTDYLLRRPSLRGFLARDGKLYYVPSWGWDDVRRSLTEEYVGLLDRTWPRLVFPLELGRAWAEAHLEAVGGRSAWVVKRREHIELGSLGTLCAWLVECISPGGEARIWFVDGVGIAREEFIGCCSLSEERRELVGFKGATL